MADTARIVLNPEAYRMAQSMYKLFRHIARRDTKAVASPKAHLIIFPTSDTALQAAITTITDRLSAVISA